MCALEGTNPSRKQLATTTVRGVLSFTGTAPAREKGGASQARTDAGMQDAGVLSERRGHVSGVWCSSVVRADPV